MDKKILVQSVRRYRGEVQGEHHDFTKITYVDFGLNAKDETNQKGNFAQEMRVGDYEYFDKAFRNNSLPAVFDMEFDLVTGRKGLELSCKNLKYITDIGVLIDTVDKK